MDNGGTAKEGVGRTYAGVDGYCPLAWQIGAYGWPLELSLRRGTQHLANDTEDNLERVIPMAQRLSAAGPKALLLTRLDSGFDSAALMASAACRRDVAPEQHPRRTHRSRKSHFATVATWPRACQTGEVAALAASKRRAMQLPEGICAMTAWLHPLLRQKWHPTGSCSEQDHGFRSLTCPCASGPGPGPDRLGGQHSILGGGVHQGFVIQKSGL